MTGSYDIWLVILSLVVASLASYVALDLAAHVRGSTTRTSKASWLVGGSLSMGTGIWSMHFIGVLALRLPIPISYDIPITLLSLVIAVFVSAFALYTVSHGTLRSRRLIGAGCLMGFGIVAMHYTGMAAMQMFPPIRYDPLFFTLSVVIAIAASMVALWIAFQLRTETFFTAFWKKFTRALVMGGAICGMNYTGMAAAIIAPNSISTVNPQSIDNTWLASMIGGFSLVLLLTTLLISISNERKADRSGKRAETLRLANAALESRTAELSRSNTLLEYNVRVLELIASWVSLPEILKAVTQLVEYEFADMLCSILLVDATGTRLGCATAPSLPEEYTAAIDGVAIGPDVGSCGTAAFLKELVVVRDIETDPRWVAFRDLARKFNLRACWSNPIMSSDRQVLGTFAMYYREPREPTERELAVIKMVSSLAGMPIEGKRGEDKLRESEIRFRSVVQTATDAIVLADKDGHIISWNRGALEIFGYGEDEVLGQPVTLIIPARFHSAHAAGVARVSTGGTPQLIGKDLQLVARRRDGSEFPIELTLNMWRAGGETFYSGTIRNITERKRAEDQMRASLAEKEVLLKEIHHRVKNNMQVISSMLNLQMGRIQDPRTREMFRDAQNRIKSMALIHERLYQQHTLARVEFAAYLRQLVAHVLRSYRTSTVTLKLEAEDLSLDIDTAVPCGLIVNELITNALKHAYPGGRAGVLTVTLRAVSDDAQGDRVQLSIADDGPGIPAGFDLRKATSLGLQLVADLTEQIGATIESSNDHGARWTLSFPASRPQRTPTANTDVLPDARNHQTRRKTA